MKRERYLSPCGIIEKRSEKDIRLSEKPVMFSFALPNPQCFFFSQSRFVAFIIDRKLSMLGGPLVSGSISLYSGYLVWNFSQVSASSVRSLKSSCKSSFSNESLVSQASALHIHKALNDGEAQTCLDSQHTTTD